ncbi:MAG: Nif3-like dinuclear metal center hexameric protein [Clostridia bacterium]
MSTVNNIYDVIDKIAPFSSSMSFDNTGILIGDKNASVKKALICLDITNTTVKEAKEIEADVIISHHPIIFHALKSIEVGTAVWNLIKGGINAICCHTNLDLCEEIGVNKALAQKLSLTNLKKTEDFFTAEISTITSNDLAKHIKMSLGTFVSYNFVEKNIKTIAMCSGAGGGIAYEVNDTDAIICGEASHDEVLEATRKNIAMFVCGHYESEKIFDKLLIDYLKDNIEDVEFVLSKDEKPALRYL